MEIDESSTASTPTAVRRPRRLGLWYAAGLLLVFFGMLLLVHITAMHSSGQYVVRLPLWMYYAVEIRRLFRPDMLGPASGSEVVLLETAVTHLLLSVAGGAIGVAVGWAISTLRNRKAIGPTDTKGGTRI